jgi:hypothetical protein
MEAYLKKSISVLVLVYNETSILPFFQERMTKHSLSCKILPV